MRLLVICLLPCFVGLSAAEPGISAKKILVVEGNQNTTPERNVVGIFSERVLKRSEVVIERVSEASATARSDSLDFDVVILLGQPRNNDLLAYALESGGIRPPTADYPGPEGFVLLNLGNLEKDIFGPLPVVVAAGADERGTIFALCRLMRESRYKPDSVVIPDLYIVDKPAFEYRGIGISHMDPHQAKRTGASMTFDYYDYTEDLMVFGFNMFVVGNGTIPVSRLNDEGFRSNIGAQAQTVSDLGLLYLKQYPPNGISQDDWKDSFRGTHKRVFACPSVPEAREIMLKGREELYRNSTQIDVLILSSGDVGGCHCEKCLPWVETYVKLCEEIANIFHKYFPDGKVWLTTQEMSFDETEWLWDYLNQESRPWLHAICHAPSGDEVSPYLTGRVNRKYERYIGASHEGRYMREIFKQIPRMVEVTSLPDISHWVSSQYALTRVSPELAAVHERRTFNARPRQMREIFQKTAGYTVGTAAYCEGIFDDVNKVVWTQLHWNPDITVEQILEDYYRWYCGEDSTPDLVDAALQLEENAQVPLLENEKGLVRFLDLVRRGGEKIPPRFRERNWRYLMLLEKGLTDLYVYHKVAEGAQRLDVINELLLKAEKSEDPESILQQCLEVLMKPLESQEMTGLREKAESVDDELNEAVGYRFVALLNMVELDLVGIQWTVDRIEEILKLNQLDEVRKEAGRLARYSDPGEGGYYDNCGHPFEAPHLEVGTDNFWSVPLVSGTRPSQVLMSYCYSGGDGVSYSYDRLDREAKYSVKMTFSRPQRAWFMREVNQSVVVDGKRVGKPITLEAGEVKQLEYEIPPSATADGRIKIDLVAESEGSATGVSEIWLMKN